MKPILLQLCENLLHHKSLEENLQRYLDTKFAENIAFDMDLMKNLMNMATALR